jgi:hypothetical protein
LTPAKYARWLRKSYAFPIRVPAYLFPSPTIITQDGIHVTASFVAPFERDIEPLIRIATGDYPELKRLRGRNDALAAYIMSLSHEIVHYYQWLECRETSERGVIVKARSMLRRYAAEVKRPWAFLKADVGQRPLWVETCQLVLPATVHGSNRFISELRGERIYRDARATSLPL